jgi:AcrR family transcriptional regulator
MGATVRSSTERPAQRRRAGRRRNRERAGSDAPGPRIGAESSATRALLVDAAERLVLEQGYAAASSRRVAVAAGVKPSLVHYYFRTMDDLLFAVFRRGTEKNLERQARALASSQPLHALWAFRREPAGTALMMEFVALANHRKAIRAEIASYADRFRGMELDMLSSLLERSRIDTEVCPPGVVSMLLRSIAQVLVMEDALGITIGHAETIAFVERSLQQLEGTG